jgi:hypothetical protein
LLIFFFFFKTDSNLFVNPMITNDNILGVFLHISIALAALCSTFYFEVIFFDWYKNSPYSSIGGFLLYPLIAYFSKKFSGNVIINELDMHNNLKSIIFMAAGYKIAFIHFNDELRNILLVTKFIWKFIINLAFPLGLQGILEKIKKAFYEGGEIKKNVNK